MQQVPKKTERLSQNNHTTLLDMLNHRQYFTIRVVHFRVKLDFPRLYPHTFKENQVKHHFSPNSNTT